MLPIPFQHDLPESMEAVHSALHHLDKAKQVLESFNTDKTLGKKGFLDSVPTIKGLVDKINPSKKEKEDTDKAIAYNALLEKYGAKPLETEYIFVAADKLKVTDWAVKDNHLQVTIMDGSSLSADFPILMILVNLYGIFGFLTNNYRFTVKLDATAKPKKDHATLDGRLVISGLMIQVMYTLTTLLVIGFCVDDMIHQPQNLELNQFLIGVAVFFQLVEAARVLFAYKNFKKQILSFINLCLDMEDALKKQAEQGEMVMQNQTAAHQQNK